MPHSKKICRICLKFPAVYYSIFETDICSMLEAITHNPVIPNIEISSVICVPCLLTLKTAYSFQNKILEGEKQLLEKVAEVARINKECEPSTKDLVDVCDNTCFICDETCGAHNEDNSINEHFRRHFSGKQFCEVCGIILNSVQEFREHLKKFKNHGDKEVHECQQCNIKFQNRNFYKVHRTLVCTDITYTFVNVDALEDNIKIEEEIRFEDGENGRMSEDESTVDDVVFVDKRLMYCEVCCKIHDYKLQHCPFCQKFITRQYLSTHMKIHTTGEQVCHICGKILQNENALKAHIYVRHESKKEKKIHKCEECNKEFSESYKLKAHKQKDHIRCFRFHCEKCGKGFYSRQSLTRHVNTTHLYVKKHVCGHCKRGFNTRFALSNHLRQHTNELPFRCEECGDGFKHNVSLKTHLKSKHNIKQRIVCHCEVCGKGFACDNGLNSHKRIHKL